LPDALLVSLVHVEEHILLDVNYFFKAFLAHLELYDAEDLIHHVFHLEAHLLQLEFARLYLVVVQSIIHQGQ